MLVRDAKPRLSLLLLLLLAVDTCGFAQRSTVRACRRPRAVLRVMMQAAPSPDDPEPTDSPVVAALAQPVEAAVPASASLSDLALNASLFVALHAFLLTGAALASGTAEPSAATALARTACVAAFVALQQAGGLPAAQWLVRAEPGAEGRAMPILDRPFAPLAAALLFGTAVCAPAAVLALSGAPEVAQLLPAARALPEPGRALDLLLGAPLEEELFFRAWLLGALRRSGAPDAAALAASAVLFAAWHAGGSDGGPLFFAVLGGWLGWLYQRSEGNLALPLATHALWNGAVIAARALRL